MTDSGFGNAIQIRSMLNQFLADSINILIIKGHKPMKRSFSVHRADFCVSLIVEQTLDDFNMPGPTCAQQSCLTCTIDLIDSNLMDSYQSLDVAVKAAAG
jgi:hypothetical protein